MEQASLESTEKFEKGKQKTTTTTTTKQQLKKTKTCVI